MNTFGIFSYGLAIAVFALLTVLMASGARGQPVAMRLIAAGIVTIVWAAVAAFPGWRQEMAFAVPHSLEAARAAAWLLVVESIGARTIPAWSRRALLTVVAMLVAVCMAPIFPDHFPVSEPLLWWLGLASTIVGLMGIGQAYRYADAEAREALRYLVPALGVLFAYDMFLYARSAYTGAMPALGWNARGVVNASVVPLLIVAIRRYPRWSPAVFISRHMVLHAATGVIVAGYLLTVVVGSHLVRLWGGRWGDVVQLLFMSLVAACLAILLLSARFRRHLSVFISKHFYRNKYDYRIEWLRFIATLTSAEESNFLRSSIRALTEILRSPGGILFTLDDQERSFVPVAAWPIPLESIRGPAPLEPHSGLAKLLRERQWIVDLEEYRIAPHLYDDMELPRWLLEGASLRIVAPLLHGERLSGFFVLYDPPRPFDLTYEDRDLLKTVGRHVATHIAQHDADRKLAESRQFEAYNRLTAFMMHDLKNATAQLQLVVSNAARHKHNPAFIDDAIDTVSNAVKNITRLTEQLARGEVLHSARAIEIEGVLERAIARCAAQEPAPVRSGPPTPALVDADAERLTAIVEHMIRNAQDATADDGRVEVHATADAATVTVAVLDSGHGMATEFVRERLFRPFDSTKGAKGMGIGAYQIREYARMLGGHVEVVSAPGRGTTFSVTLPRHGVAAAAEQVVRGDE